MADVVKYGVQISNRIFVGGVAFDTKESDLKEFFTQYGRVKECKIVKDSQQISRGFAFVTFECKHDAFQAQQLGTVFFNQKKLNIGPAIRQKGVVFNPNAESVDEPTGMYMHPSGVSYPVSPNPALHVQLDQPLKSRTFGANLYSTPNYPGNAPQVRGQSFQPLNPCPSKNAHPAGVPYLVTPPHFAQTGEGFDNNSHPYHSHVVQAPGYGHHLETTIETPNVHLAFQNLSITYPQPSTNLKVVALPNHIPPTAMGTQYDFVRDPYLPCTPQFIHHNPEENTWNPRSYHTLLQPAWNTFPEGLRYPTHDRDRSGKFSKARSNKFQKVPSSEKSSTISQGMGERKKRDSITKEDVPEPSDSLE